MQQIFVFFVMSFQPAEDLLPELLLSEAPIMNFLDVLNLIRQFVLSTFFTVRIETFLKVIELLVIYKRWSQLQKSRLRVHLDLATVGNGTV